MQIWVEMGSLAAGELWNRITDTTISSDLAFEKAISLGYRSTIPAKHHIEWQNGFEKEWEALTVEIEIESVI